MKKFLFLLSTILFISTISVVAQDKHEMQNMRVSILSKEHKNSRFIEEGSSKGKEYIQGKKSSYNKKGESVNKKSLAPYAEYGISSGLAGGTYEVTVHYILDKNATPDEPQIILGMDLLDSQELTIKNKLINTVKADFKVKALRGKNHTLKIWLPSQGVRVHKFEVRKKLIGGSKS